VFLLFWIGVQAQTQAKSYYFEDDEVVFQFDIRLYQEAVATGQLEELEFADFDINRIVISGNFNRWSRKAWKMKQVGPNTYQLRKKITAFNDVISWDFKFLINGQYWVDPAALNPSEKILDQGIWKGVYDLDLYDVAPVEKGNADFILEGFPDASTVILTGSFNGWNETALEMIKRDDLWLIQLQLQIGRYEYKFIVDGVWMHDPANSEKVENEYDTFNSVLQIKKQIIFELNEFAKAEEVILAGSFTDWQEGGLSMKKTDQGWQIPVALGEGKHFYKFIVDGRWITDPRNPLSEYDLSGNLNSVLLVQ
jgi:hypothetical protein